MEIMNQPSEKDFLRYEGSKVPRIIRLAWTIFIVFALLYSARFLTPDLLNWLRK